MTLASHRRVNFSAKFNFWGSISICVLFSARTYIIQSIKHQVIRKDHIVRVNALHTSAPRPFIIDLLTSKMCRTKDWSWLRKLAYVLHTICLPYFTFHPVCQHREMCTKFKSCICFLCVQTVACRTTATCTKQYCHCSGNYKPHSQSAVISATLAIEDSHLIYLWDNSAHVM